MLLLALAMLTFWDSQYLPQGAECGSWQDSICQVIRKDALEEMTWMLASGGQVVFLGIIGNFVAKGFFVHLFSGLF